MNYQKLTDKVTEEIAKSGIKPRLMLHSCCAPCSSYVIDYLCEYFNVTVFYCNHNIFPEEEYLRRKSDQLRLIDEYRKEGKSVDYTDCDYDYNRFLEYAKGLEKEKEGGKRCKECFLLRMRETALKAVEMGYDYFATTLTVSPHKNAEIINEVGALLEKEYAVKYLYSDFKKKNGYLTSIKLSERYGLYRQKYCGCAFSQWNVNTENVNAKDVK